MTEVSRCTGHCCKDFTLPFSPMELERWKRRVARGQTEIIYEGFGRWGLAKGSRRPEVKRYSVQHAEMKKLFDMLIFKRTDHQAANHADRTTSSKKNDREGWAHPHKGARFHHYTCKHFDAQKQLCRNYEDRPNMCRSYPDGGQCNYKGCTRKCEFIQPDADTMEKHQEASL